MFSDERQPGTINTRPCLLRCRGSPSPIETGISFHVDQTYFAIRTRSRPCVLEMYSASSAFLNSRWIVES
jgi:hypothetical protein